MNQLKEKKQSTGIEQAETVNKTQKASTWRMKAKEVFAAGCLINGD